MEALLIIIAVATAVIAYMFCHYCFKSSGIGRWFYTDILKGDDRKEK